MQTDTQIQSAIKAIRQVLFTKRVNKKINFAVKEGYLEAVEILREKRTDYTGIDKLTTTQGRAIAVLAVDFVNGECERQILCGVPLR